MKKFFLTVAAIASLLPTFAGAEEPTTELGIYLFASEVSGDVEVRNATIDVDASFSEILDSLDLGFMGYIEHRRDKWSFIGDLVYLKIEDDASASAGPLTVDVDIGLEQTLLEGFAGYNVLERDYGESELNLDVLVGARYVLIESKLSAGVSPLGLPSGSRSIDEDWTDAVIGVRIRNTYQNGWSSKVWIDAGEGSDSSSYQFMALVGYQKSDSWKLFGGYRYLNLEYEKGSGTSRFGVDLDYSGPIFGANYRL